MCRFYLFAIGFLRFSIDFISICVAWFDIFRFPLGSLRWWSRSFFIWHCLHWVRFWVGITNFYDNRLTIACFVWLYTENAMKQKSKSCSMKQISNVIMCNLSYLFCFDTDSDILSLDKRVVGWRNERGLEVAFISFNVTSKQFSSLSNCQLELAIVQPSFKISAEIFEIESSSGL